MAEAPGNFGSLRQMEIYLAGLAGKMPELPLSIDELERRAREVMKPEAYDYVAGGASSEDTNRANLDAFSRWRIVPKMLCDVLRRDLSVELFGAKLPAPVLLAPVGVQEIIHADAELAVARAAAAVGLPMILSTVSSKPIEQVAEVNGNGVRWFQLYWPRDEELAVSFIQRAERSGYTALVVTLDTHTLGWRERDLQRAYLPFLMAQGMANYLSDPIFRAALPGPPEQNPEAAVRHWLSLYSRPELTWSDLSWVREHTKLPILLKGLQHPDDARKALDAGMDGIIVSNHGGRQVDGAIASLDALPPFVEVVNGRIPVLFDSGIRRGADAFKALALGAKAILLGRPYLWGLAVAGEQGVRDVLLNFLADLDLTAAMSGCCSLDHVSRDLLVRA